MTPSGIEPATFRFVAQHYRQGVHTSNNYVQNIMKNYS